jgi:hypothetical protein
LGALGIELRLHVPPKIRASFSTSQVRDSFSLEKSISSAIGYPSHNLKVVGSNPTPATKLNPVDSISWQGFSFNGPWRQKLNGNRLATAWRDLAGSRLSTVSPGALQLACRRLRSDVTSCLNRTNQNDEAHDSNCRNVPSGGDRDGSGTGAEGTDNFKLSRQGSLKQHCRSRI